MARIIAARIRNQGFATVESNMSLPLVILSCICWRPCRVRRSARSSKTPPTRRDYRHAGENPYMRHRPTI